jgi:hypothetical protein
MNTLSTNGSDEAIEMPKKRRGRPASPKPADGSRDAKRLAALVLEVLAGARTPADAASALGVSIGCYYNAETRAIAGLVAACEPLSSAQRRSSEVELATLKKENERLQRDAARHLALARVAQRTIGVSAPSQPTKDAKGKKRRAPRVRALKAVKELAVDESKGDGQVEET